MRGADRAIVRGVGTFSSVGLDRSWHRITQDDSTHGSIELDYTSISATTLERDPPEHSRRCIFSAQRKDKEIQREVLNAETSSSSSKSTYFTEAEGDDETYNQIDAFIEPLQLREVETAAKLLPLSKILSSSDTRLSNPTEMEAWIRHAAVHMARQEFFQRSFREYVAENPPPLVEEDTKSLPGADVQNIEEEVVNKGTVSVFLSRIFKLLTMRLLGIKERDILMAHQLEVQQGRVEDGSRILDKLNEITVLVGLLIVGLAYLMRASPSQE